MPHLGVQAVWGWRWLTDRQAAGLGGETADSASCEHAHGLPAGGLFKPDPAKIRSRKHNPGLLVLGRITGFFEVFFFLRGCSWKKYIREKAKGGNEGISLSKSST